MTEYLFHIKIWIFILSSKVNVFHILKTFTLKMPKIDNMTAKNFLVWKIMRVVFKNLEINLRKTYKSNEGLNFWLAQNEHSGKFFWFILIQLFKNWGKHGLYLIFQTILEQSIWHVPSRHEILPLMLWQFPGRMFLPLIFIWFYIELNPKSEFLPPIWPSCCANFHVSRVRANICLIFWASIYVYLNW